MFEATQETIAQAEIPSNRRGTKQRIPVLVQLNHPVEERRQRLSVMGHALLFSHILGSVYDRATVDNPIQKSRHPPLEVHIHSASSDRSLYS